MNTVTYKGSNIFICENEIHIHEGALVLGGFNTRENKFNLNKKVKLSIIKKENEKIIIELECFCKEKNVIELDYNENLWIELMDKC